MNIKKTSLIFLIFFSIESRCNEQILKKKDVVFLEGKQIVRLLNQYVNSLSNVELDKLKWWRM